MKRFAAFLMAACLVLLRTHAQEQPSASRFEVATIRLHPDCIGAHEQESPGRFGILCVPLREVIRVAYGNAEGRPSPGRLAEVVGGPHWLDADRYDILATAPENPGLDQMYGPMTRALLEDRLRLKLHDEVRSLPVYNLAVLKKTAKLKPTEDGSCVVIDLKTVLQSPPQLPNYCGRFTLTKGTTTVFDGYGVTINEFIARVLRTLDRPVIDRTGLTGRFDIHLEFASTDLLDAADTSQPSIFTAIQEQLGLKLANATGPVDVHVIDHIERPSEN
jgi:uncharacterized protein (TIGR03435 family)